MFSVPNTKLQYVSRSHPNIMNSLLSFRWRVFARRRIPPRPPLSFPGLPLPSLGSGSPRDATHSFGRRVFRMYQPLFSRLLRIPWWVRGGWLSPAYSYLPLSTLLAVHGFEGAEFRDRCC